MRLPETRPTTAIRHWQEHEIPVQPLCPDSHNPRPGSTITIGYWATNKVLEVAALYAYIHQYKGGLKNDEGEIVIRSMEEMVSMTCQHCREALGTAVAVVADWIVLPYQKVHMVFDPERIRP